LFLYIYIICDCNRNTVNAHAQNDAFVPCDCGLAVEIRPSVRLSVKRVYCDKTKETSTEIIMQCERLIIILVFRQEKWLVGGATPCIWNFGPTRSCKNADFQSTFARSASAV